MRVGTRIDEHFQKEGRDVQMQKCMRKQARLQKEGRYQSCLIECFRCSSPGKEAFCKHTIFFFPLRSKSFPIATQILQFKFRADQPQSSSVGNNLRKSNTVRLKPGAVQTMAPFFSFPHLLSGSLSADMNTGAALKTSVYSS